MRMRVNFSLVNIVPRGRWLEQTLKIDPMLKHIISLSILAACGHQIAVAQGVDVIGTLVTTRDIPVLFDGKNLDGWIKRGGKGSYEVVDGVIVGRCNVKGGGNTFLCTGKDYGDFILELEVKSDKGLNSGVQIRSHCIEKETTYDFGDRQIRISANRVHGYQVEVDNNANRRWSGGIYDEARRGWLFPLPTNAPASKSYRLGEWNRYRIECRGASIKTWVNDIPAADLIDAETMKGFIGLQVHSADDPDYQVRFRDIRLKALGEHDWQTAWVCRSFEGMEKRGGAEWKLSDGILTATRSGSGSGDGILFGHTPMSDITIRFSFKADKGGFAFGLLDSPDNHSKPTVAIPFRADVGSTNFAKADGWNRVSVTLKDKRLVVALNGRQIRDETVSALPATVLPALILASGQESEVRFKAFEVLAAKQ